MGIILEPLPADVLSPSDLARRVISGALQLDGLPLPRCLSDIPRPAERRDEEARAALAESLEEGLAPLAPPVAVLDSVRALAKPGTWAVVTGQQPGLLAGPLYSLHKALHAAALARDLTRAWKTPVVPVFWNHGDDHDVAEANRTFFQNENLDVEKLSLRGLSSGRQPLSAILLDEETHGLEALATRLRSILPPGPAREAALELFLPRPGESIARAFTRTLTGLLGSQGLVVVEPDWIREDLSRALAGLVSGPSGSGAAGLPEALAAGAHALAATDLPVAIDPAAAALLFHVDEDGRRALRPGGDGYRYDGEPGSRTAAELAAEIIQEPAAWSAGTLLRPLVQDAVLPTAAVIGGWGELAYQAQLGPARDLAGLPPVPFLPRVSITLTDAECRASLAKTELAAAGILAGEALTVKEGGAEGSPISGTHRAVADLREAAERLRADLLSLRPALAEVDPSLVAGLKRAADQARKGVLRVADKAARVVDNQSGGSRRHKRRLAATLMPRGIPQERMAGPLPWVARFGTSWIDELLSEIDPFAPEPLLVHLSVDGDPPQTPSTPDPT